MLRHRRVALVAGLAGALFALVLPLAITSPAAALTDNVVSVTKVVNGTPTQAGNFEVVVECTDGVTFSTQTLTFTPAGGTQQAGFPEAFTDCEVVETQTRGADATSIQATSATAAIVVPNGNDATVPVEIVFDPDGTQTANVGIKMCIRDRDQGSPVPAGHRHRLRLQVLRGPAAGVIAQALQRFRLRTRQLCGRLELRRGRHHPARGGSHGQAAALRGWPDHRLERGWR